ncbi:uncharacterized protein MAM_01452 [Metarhizium album ARSEF 1941]|uniref:Uncharacterized protein n=1 Tax=Metarhizium album (strain ARSEF 1941) TaxID=1081103 RepID=A0A0B2X2X4_METAS|nr:uncharacterized protein MAM_01452 [Metarhizium album ARSEF 1941]KHO00674.1 hypothetical protein MAM_01452 [Metarhizium album ARSEF 1941]
MPEAGNDLKPPKPRRPPPKDDNIFSRQVRFDDSNPKTRPGSAANSNVNNPDQAPKNTQPDSHPQVGQPALPNLNRPPSGQWYTAADPTRSVNLAGSQQVYASFPHQNPHVQFQPQAVAQGLPYRPPPNMGDYQNCVPPPTGVNFQPPAPDTTFGPMPHLYVPRFDAGPVYGGGVVHQPVSAAPQSYVVQPGMVPMAQQPVMVNAQAYVHMCAPGIPAQPVMSSANLPAPMMAAAAAAPGACAHMPIIPGNPPPPTCATMPEVSGMGRTPNEEMLRQVEFAYSNRLFEPQDFKPADDDPSRFYYVREVDGNWTQRNRFTIDHMGDCRWYVTDEGWFYAVRLPD